MRRYAAAVAFFSLLALAGCLCFDLEGFAPSVSLTLNSTSGSAPFYPGYSYGCGDIDNDLLSCELRLDGQTFAKGSDTNTVMPAGYKYPEFYDKAVSTPGTHTMEVVAYDRKGHNASKKASFTVRATAPFVNLSLNSTSGPAPFWVHYMRWCSDPDGDLLYCELRIDGQAYARGQNSSAMFPDNYTTPDLYYTAISTMGEHELELYAEDRAGHNSSVKRNFTVLQGAYLSAPGWYTCNNRTNPPCDDFQSAYCSKIVPTDMKVREAASKAISAHPGAYSVNQILDVYDWVYSNVIYQNVPVNLTYQPYDPSETLKTKSGDCKNHAVLIASMIEAIGGRARVLLIPGCQHAFAEVYLGDKSNTDRFTKAVFAHYESTQAGVTWHTSKNDTEIWYPLDTAGGRYPGNSIAGCFNATQTFAIYNCYVDPELLNAPDVKWIEYGPANMVDSNIVVQPLYWKYWGDVSVDSTRYDYCKYNIELESKSRTFDWWIMTPGQYQNLVTDYPYMSYYQESQVYSSDYEFTAWPSYGKFRIVLKNTDPYNGVTIHRNVTSRCYKE